jgi:queuine tRNA-ribosyltransferase
VGEILGVRLLTMHNLYRYAEVMRAARTAIEEGRFGAFREAFLKTYHKVQEEHSEQNRGEGS